MKFPSIFRVNSPMRFDIKPRYYDPVKEEIEQRTSKIKKDLEMEGRLEKSKDETNHESRCAIMAQYLMGDWRKTRTKQVWIPFDLF